ncbi:hypothetical protein WA1_44340 [Scytonema hofmannii PCC 7110]|uniref:histidine kinase n=1 Tax=Scytonema hofmannii PCC 7110 TaxID=128403 RepID=A0A139WWF6_9CYAN|nr:hypothetical protein [Scytonema hofmannii]KYC36712.1 hypothetical protein WA1_44340 [Scytonema hofmannii PCC 7110]
MEIWTLWHPTYWLSGSIKAFTAIVSLYTASEMVLLMPKALALPSPAQLEAVNIELRNQIAQRQKAESALQKANDDLSDRSQLTTVMAALHLLLVSSHPPLLKSFLWHQELAFADQITDVLSIA